MRKSYLKGDFFFSPLETNCFHDAHIIFMFIKNLDPEEKKYEVEDRYNMPASASK